MSSVGSSSNHPSRAAQEAARARKAQAKAEAGALEGAAALQSDQPAAAKEQGAPAQPQDSYSKVPPASPEEMVEQARRSREARSKHYLSRIKEQFAEGTGKPKKRRGSRQDGAGSTQKAQGTKEAEPAAQLTPELSEKLRLQRGGKAAEEMNASTGESAQGDALTPELREKLRLQRGGKAAEEMNASTGEPASADRLVGAALPAGVAAGASTAAARSASPAMAQAEALERTAAAEPSAAEQTKLGSAIRDVLSGTPKARGEAIAALKDMVADGKKSDDKRVKNLASAADNVLKGLELLEKEPKGKFDTFKAAMHFAQAGPDVIKAGLEQAKKSNLIDEKTGNMLMDVLGGTPGMLNGFTKLCEGLDELGKGNVGQGLKMLMESGADNFSAVAPLLKHGKIMSEERIKQVQGLLNTGADAVGKVVKGLEQWDKGNKGEAMKHFASAGQKSLGALLPLMGEKMKDCAAWLGPLASAAGGIMGAAEHIGEMCDNKLSYNERLGAAQRAFTALGVEALRGLASAAFGKTIGKGVADTCEWVANAAIDYDQETAKRWAEAGELEDGAWNKGAKFGAGLAKTLGWDDKKTATDPDHLALSHLRQYWASPDSTVRKAMTEVLKTLRTEGPEAARDKYLGYVKQWRQSGLHQKITGEK
jgi:hypothetical protein